jgi:lantibiotic modifying enzyme
MAGIASVLAEMHRYSGGSKYRAAAQKAAKQLRVAAIPTLDRSRGLMWPVSNSDRTLSGPFWCHGAAGIGSFFLELWRDAIDRRGLEIAEAAARSTLASGRWLGPTQCHGLSGSIEFLLDLYQATGRSEWREGAQTLGILLAEYAAGRARDRLANTGLGFFTGFSGTLAALIRLSDPEARRRLLGYGFLPPPAPTTPSRRRRPR